MRVRERDERTHGVGLGDRVRVGNQHVLAARRRDAEVDVRSERERPRILEDPHVGRHAVGGTGQIGDHERLVDLGRERRQRARELRRMPVGHDDGRDLHVPSISR
jgi:hypothetical protein